MREALHGRHEGILHKPPLMILTRKRYIRVGRNAVGMHMPVVKMTRNGPIRCKQRCPYASLAIPHWLLASP